MWFCCLGFCLAWFRDSILYIYFHHVTLLSWLLFGFHWTIHPAGSVRCVVQKMNLIFMVTDLINQMCGSEFVCSMYMYGFPSLNISISSSIAQCSLYNKQYFMKDWFFVCEWVGRACSIKCCSYCSSSGSTHRHCLGVTWNVFICFPKVKLNCPDMNVCITRHVSYIPYIIFHWNKMYGIPLRFHWISIDIPLEIQGDSLILHVFWLNCSVFLDGNSIWV